MKEQAEKLKDIEKELSDSKGPFELFALFLREGAPGKWDLIISADWARSDKRAAINLIVEKIRKVFTDQEMLMLSRLAILDKDNAALKALHGAVQVEHGLAEISDSNFFGLAIKHAYLITSKR
jgi:hypothetical protein